MTKRSVFAPREYPVQARARERTRPSAAAMTTASDTSTRPQIHLVAVSIQDYEVLTAPREAFVNFLLNPHPSDRAQAVEARPTGL